MKKNYVILTGILLSAIICKSQSIVSVVPNSAAAGQTLNVTITGSGTHFLSGSNTTLQFGFEQCSGTIVNSLMVNSNTSISANITVPVSVYNNAHDVELYNLVDGFVVADHVFSVSGGIPYTVSLSPNSASAGQTLNVSITGTGTHFQQGSTTALKILLDLDQRVCFESSNFFMGTPTSDTYMTSTFTIPPGTDTGYYDVSILGGFDNFGILQNIFHVTGPTAVQELENVYHIEVFPNPFSDVTQIQYTLDHPEAVLVEVYDLFGRKILTENQGKQKSGLHSLKIDAAGLTMANGIYYLRFSAGNRNFTKKILLNR